MAQHRLYGGSTIGRAMLCRASARAASKFPSQAGIYAHVGTLCHSLLERGIKEQLDDVSFLIGTADGLTDDVCSAVTMALSYVRPYQKRGLNVLAESKVSLPGYEMIAGGTADVVIFNDKNDDDNEIIDFKTGYRAVDATDPQLAFYALCAFGVKPVTCTVIQPNGYYNTDGPIRSHSYTAEEMAEFDKKVRQVIEEAEEDNAPYSPSAKACLYCNAAPYCKAIEEKLGEVAALRNVRCLAEGAGTLTPAEKLSRAELGKILDAASLFSNWLSALQKAAYARAMEGEKIPGYKLVAKRKARKWVNDKPKEKIAELLSKVSGIASEDFFRKDLLTITDAELKLKNWFKEIGFSKSHVSNMARDAIAYATFKEQTADLALVPASDNRAEVNRTEEAFKLINLEGLPK